MIRSKQQLCAANKRAKALFAQLKAPALPGVPFELVEGYERQALEELAIIVSDIAEYKKALAGDLSSIKAYPMEKLGKAPIIIRLASHLSIQKFSKLIPISESQLKRYEQCEYENAPLGLVQTIVNHADDLLAQHKISA